MSEQSLVVRFAPSPTGYLHIGGARTCLFNWLFARSSKARFIMRIEDTDLQRSKKEYLDEILESISWLGMDWDQIYYQSKRFDLYREYADKLVSSGKAVFKEGAIFFNYVFNSVRIDDLIRGPIVFNELPKNEEVIIKSDGSPAYNFACVVDDVLTGVNCVIRGEDHISNTPKQVLMYEALGFPVPAFAHLALILSPAGGRLSKRFGATSIREYRMEGFLPEALANYLLLLGWSPGNDREIISLDEAIKLFDIKGVNKTGAAFSMDKLNWINSEYLRSKSTDEFSAIMAEYLRGKTKFNIPQDEDYLKKLAALFKERATTLNDLIEFTRPFFCDNINYDQEAAEALKEPLASEINLLKQTFGKIEAFTAQNIEAAMRQAAVDLGVKLKALVHPVRSALTGKRHGAGLFETIELLGKEKVIKRLEALIDYWGGAKDE